MMMLSGSISFDAPLIIIIITVFSRLAIPSSSLLSSSAAVARAWARRRQQYNYRIRDSVLRPHRTAQTNIQPTTLSVSSTVTEEIGKVAEVETEKLYKWYASLIDSNRETGTTLPFDSTALPTVWMTNAEPSRYIRDEIDTVLFDCDGVLYRTQEICPGATECLRSLIIDQKKNVFFVTNNSATNRRQLQRKLSKLLQLDDDVLRVDQMVSSAYCCARYLQQHFATLDQQELKEDNGNDNNNNNTRTKNRIRRVHVIGSTGLCEELVSAGFEITGGPDGSASSDSNDKTVIAQARGTSSSWGTMTRQDLEDYPFNESPIDALVVGHDVSMNFRKLTIAHNLLLRNPGAIFVASNEDAYDLVGSDSRHIPGNGATVKALEYCSNRKAINVGKPSTTLTEILSQDYPNALGSTSDMSRCLMVGDRLDTDIRFGVNNRMKSLLVMTGVTTAETMKALGHEGTEDQPFPTFIVPYVGMMV
jgi:phosphoglycolate/pyridoxal phosphate phosphatase family enzyme